MREITCVGLILFVLWLAFSGPTESHIAPARSMPLSLNKLPVRPRVSADTIIKALKNPPVKREYPRIIDERGHHFIKLYDDGYTRKHCCTKCGLIRISRGE